MRHAFDPRHPFRPSLDRIDKGLGYTRANTRVVWLIENLARNRFTDADVIKFCTLKLQSAGHDQARQEARNHANVQCL